MEKSPWQKILRIFFQFSSPVLIYIEQGKIRGVIYKSQVEQSVSDLNVFRAGGAEIPIEPIHSLEELLALHQKYAQNDNGNQVLPVVNKNHDFVGLWQRADLVNGLEVIKRVETWQPRKVSIKNLEAENNQPRVAESDQVATQQPRQKITITRLKEPTRVEEKAEPEAEEAEEQQIEETAQPARLKVKIPQKMVEKPRATELPALPDKVKKHLEHGYLAILALQTLSIPLLAVDTSGEELFINEDFVNEQKQYRHILNGEYLVKHAKDLMANLAIKGQLKADDTLQLELLGKNRNIFMRPIRREPVGSYVKFDETKSKTVGYLFWIEQPTEVQEPAKRNEFLVKDFNNRETRGFLGKTLPDIIQTEEKKAMLWALEESGGNLSNAAMLLGIPRQTFSYKYHKYFDKEKEKGRA